MFSSLKKVFSEKKYSLLFFLFFLIFFFLFLFLPIFLNKNTFFFQLFLYRKIDFFIFILFSILLSLLLTLQIYLFSQKRRLRHLPQRIVWSGLGIYSGILASLLTTASCSLCLLGFLGFLGAGGMLFFFQNKVWIILLAGGILVFSIFLTLKSLNKNCKCDQKYERKRN